MSTNKTKREGDGTNNTSPNIPFMIMPSAPPNPAPFPTQGAARSPMSFIPPQSFPNLFPPLGMYPPRSNFMFPSQLQSGFPQPLQPDGFGIQNPLSLVASAAAAAADSKLPQDLERKEVDSGVERKREMNRINAARSRLRKKIKLEAMVIRAVHLEHENLIMKHSLSTNGREFSIPKKNILPTTNLPADYKILNPFHMVETNFLLTMLDQNEFIVMSASPGISATTGYPLNEIIGSACNILKGDHIDKNTVEMIKDSLSRNETVMSILPNYRKDGTMFWNQLYISTFEVQDHARWHLWIQREMKMPNNNSRLEDSV